MNGLNEHGHFGREWRSDAACRNEDPDICFPISEKDTQSAQILEAKAICMGCLVIDICLAEALDNREPFGIWGGLATPERDAILRRNLRAS